MWNLPFFEFLILLHGVLGTTQCHFVICHYPNGWLILYYKVSSPTFEFDVNFNIGGNPLVVAT
jgi:hypothetical protein